MSGSRLDETENINESQEHLRTLWSSGFAMLCIARLFNSFVFNILTVVIAPYCMLRYGVGAGIAGAVVGVYVLAALLIRVFVGSRQDVIGRGRILRWGSVMFLLSTVLYLLPLSLPALVGVRILHGCAFGAVTNVSTVVATDLVAPERRGEGLGYYALGGTIASAIGPFLGTWIFYHSSSHVLFAVCVLFAFVAMAFALPVRVREISAGEMNSEEQCPKISLDSVVERSAIPMSAIMFLLAMCYTSVTSFLSDFAGEIGLARVAPWFFLVYATAAVIARPVAGRIFDSKGDTPIMYPMIPSFALGIFLLATCSSSVQFLLSAVFFAIGFTSVFACIQTCVIGRSDDAHMSIAASTFYTFADAGHGLGPVILGSTTSFLGYRGMFCLAIAVSMAMLAAYHLIKMAERKACRN